MSRSTRLVRLLLCLGVLALSGCAALGFGSRSRGIDRIVETQELRVGITGEQPPLNMTARDGELIGLEVALVKVLAKSMEVDAKLVRRPFSELLDAMDDGDVDIVISGMTITPERSARAIFVGPYYTSGKCLLTKSEALATIQEPGDLNNPTLSIAALEGSTSQAFIERLLPIAQHVLTATLDEAIQLVREDQVDALLADRETCRYGVLRWPDSGLRASTSTYTIEPLGIAVPKDQPELASLIESYIDALNENGVIEKVRVFWFENPSWVRALR